MLLQRTTLGSVNLRGDLGGKTITHSMEIDVKQTAHIDLPLHRVAAKYQIKEFELNDKGNNFQFPFTLVLRPLSLKIITYQVFYRTVVPV